MATITVPTAWLQNDAHDLAIVGALRQANVSVDFIRHGLVYVGNKPTGKLVSKVEGAKAILSVETLPTAPAPVVAVKPSAADLDTAAEEQKTKEATVKPVKVTPTNPAQPVVTATVVPEPVPETKVPAAEPEHVPATAAAPAHVPADAEEVHAEPAK